MRNILSEKVQNIKPSGIRKFFDIVSEMKDAISLGVGEPDFETPWHIRDEGIYALEKGKTFYTSNAGLKELRTEISNYLKRIQNLEYNPMKEILVTVGGSEAIDIGLRAMINPGDEVIIPQPSYVSYEPCAYLAGAKTVIINLKAENEFRLTPEELEAAITDKTKVLILPYPNNPTGAILEQDDLEKIAKIIIEKRKNGEFFNFFHFMIDLTGGPCVAKRLSGCGSGTEYLAVTPWGDLYPCHQFVGEEKFLLGNVFDGIKRTDICDEFRSCNVYTKKKCKDCFARFYCSGGCPANSYNFHGTIDDSYDLSCDMERKRVECAIMIKAALADTEGEEE